MAEKFLLSMLFVFLLLVDVPVQAQDIQDLIAAVIQNNKGLVVSRETVRRTEKEYQALQAQYLPLLAFDSSYRYVSDVAAITLPLVPPRQIETSTHENMDAGLSLSYLLFNGNAREASLSIRKTQLDIAVLQLRRQERDIAFQVVKQVLSLAILGFQRKIILNSEARVRENLRKVTALRSQGMAVDLDGLSLELLLAKYDQQQLEIESSITIQCDQLSVMAGMAILDFPHITMNVTDELPALRIEGQEELQLLRCKKQIAWTSATISAARNQPEVLLNTAYRLGKPGVNPIDNQWMTYYTVGASVRFNVWDFGSSDLNVKANKKDVTILEEQYQQALEQLNLNYRNSIKEDQVLLGQHRLQQKTAQLALRRFELTQVLYEKGQASVNDLKNADLDLTEAQLLLQQLQGRMKQKYVEIAYISALDTNKWRLQE